MVNPGFNMENDLQKVVENVKSSSADTKKKVEESRQLVVFGLDDEEYAVPIQDLQEIIKIPIITPIPGAPEFISGIFNLRGRIVVAINLEKRFNLARKKNVPSNHVVVSEINNNIFGIIVDNVAEVIQVPVSQIKPTPTLVSTKIKGDYLKGVVVMGEGNDETQGTENGKGKGGAESGEKSKTRLIILMDLPKLLQEKELLDFGTKLAETVKS